LALGALISISALVARAEEPADVAWRKAVALKLTADPTGKLRLTASTRVEQTYLSARSVQNTRFTFPEQYYASVSDLQAWARGKALRDSAFGHTYPQQRDVFMSSTKVHHVDFPGDLKAGEQIAYSYSEAFKDLAFTPLYPVFDRDCVEGFTISVEHPADVMVDFSCFLPRGAKPEITRPSATRTVLAFGKLPRLEHLAHFEWNGLHAVVLPRFTRGGVALNPTTPEAFAAWYRTLLGPEPEPAEALRQAAQAAVAKAATPREKAKALFDLVKEKVRYAADERDMGAIVPRPPAEVLARGYGDCKDKAHLLETLGRLCGLDLPMVLVATDPSAELKELQVGLFDHVINTFDEGGRRTFMDPTHPYVEFGNLPDSDIGKDALLLGAKAERLRIPAPQRKPSLEIRVKAGLEDLKQGKAEVILRNDYLALAREALKELRPLDAENRLSNAVNARLAKLSLDEFKLLDEKEGEARFEASANLEAFLTASTTRRYLPQAPFRALDPELAARKDDALPIHLEASPWMRLELQLAGAGWKAKRETWDTAPAGPFLARAASSGDLRFEFEVKQDLLIADGEGRPAFLAFLTELLQRRRNLFTLERSEK
jgi:hypothetical protein